MRSQHNLAVQLVHIFGPRKGQIDEFFDMPITVGRHPSCSLVFPVDQKGISRQHAEIIREGNQFKLIDHSTNGTFINGKPVKEAILKDGDILEFAEAGPKVSFLSVVSDVSKEESITPPVVSQRIERQEIQPRSPSQPVRRVPEYHEPPEISVEIKASVAVAMPIERGVSNGLRRVKAPLTIQFGAQIRSFKELPVVIGSGVGCEFPVEHPHILEKHLQILFYDNTYRIEDLTGRTLVRVNNKPLDANRALQPNDEVQLSPHGPVFCFLGEGRFAEVIDEAAPGSSHVSDRPGSERFDPSPNKPAESIWEKIKNKF